jgi:hypothetical protein
VGTTLVTFLDSPLGRFRNVWHQHVRVAFAERPDLQPTRDTARQQRPTCLELRVPRLVNESGAPVTDAVILASVAADGRRFDVYAVSILLFAICFRLGGAIAGVAHHHAPWGVML